jgi:hypothetical protein
MPATDTFSTTSAALTSPAEHAFAITPHDSNSLSFVTREMYVGSGGDVVAVFAGGEEVTLSGVPSGSRLPYRVTQVKATGTTATALVGLY